MITSVDRFSRASGMFKTIPTFHPTNWNICEIAACSHTSHAKSQPIKEEMK